MQVEQEVNFPRIKETLQACCHSEEDCGRCKGRECLIGFAKIVSDYAGVKHAMSIPNGMAMVPTGDFKTYETDDVAKALAIINLECKNCMDNHDDNCIVNIIRSSLEVALIGNHVDFPGNPLMYLMTLNTLNAEAGGKVMAYYSQLKSQIK